MVALSRSAFLSSCCARAFCSVLPAERKGSRRVPVVVWDLARLLLTERAASPSRVSPPVAAIASRASSACSAFFA